MNAGYVWTCVLILFVTTYFTRLLPFLIFKGNIKNKFIRSILAYLPYAVLSSIIFPEVFEQKGMGLLPAVVGFFVAVILSYKEKSLIIVLAFSSILTYVFMVLDPYITSFLHLS
ncbi:MAG: AzlD domain-containing protein [Clostridia bacterium]|nr:AzlD domain-containing protein [Clostridia bacterium]